MPIFWNFRPMVSPLVPGGTMKLAWPRPFSSGATEATTTCTSAMPPLVIQVLVAVEHPLVPGLVVDGPGPHAR